jgi:hypothetical protein
VSRWTNGHFFLLCVTGNYSSMNRCLHTVPRNKPPLYTNKKMTALWDFAPYTLVDIGRHFRGACCPIIRVIIAMMMEAISFSKTSVSIYQTTRSSIAEDSHFYTRRRENVKCHIQARLSTNVIFANSFTRYPAA